MPAEVVSSVRLGTGMVDMRNEVSLVVKVLRVKVDVVVVETVKEVFDVTMAIAGALQVDVAVVVVTDVRVELVMDVLMDVLLEPAAV